MEHLIESKNKQTKQFFGGGGGGIRGRQTVEERERERETRFIEIDKLRKHNQHKFCATTVHILYVYMYIYKESIVNNMCEK